MQANRRVPLALWKATKASRTKPGSHVKSSCFGGIEGQKVGRASNQSSDEASQHLGRILVLEKGIGQHCCQRNELRLTLSSRFRLGGASKQSFAAVFCPERGHVNNDRPLTTEQTALLQSTAPFDSRPLGTKLCGQRAKTFALVNRKLFRHQSGSERNMHGGDKVVGGVGYLGGYGRSTWVRSTHSGSPTRGHRAHYLAPWKRRRQGISRAVS